MNITFFVFAGRQANMEVQYPLLCRLLDKYPGSELDLWDLTRTPEDAEYLDVLDGDYGGRVCVIRNLHPGHPIQCLYPNGQVRLRGWRRCGCMIHTPPYEKPYQVYASRYEKSDTIYVKIDDDVLFLETERFDDMLTPLAEHPNRVISANVINNAVCAKYDVLTSYQFAKAYGDPTNPANDRAWWNAHTETAFLRASHDWFLDHITLPDYTMTPKYVRTRPGEAISINCIAFTQATMNRLARAFTYNPRLGDEGVVDSYLPWICKTVSAAHLAFGPQERELPSTELTAYREAYRDLVLDYLRTEVTA